jgi:hypothetical protein
VAEGQVPDFSGNWKQSNEQCSPKRTGDVTLKINHRNPELVVETTSKGLTLRHAVQRYTTDGVESKSIGADGDEFHSTAVWNWKGDTLVFEHHRDRRRQATEIERILESGRRRAKSEAGASN